MRCSVNFYGDDGSQLGASGAESNLVILTEEVFYEFGTSQVHQMKMFASIHRVVRKIPRAKVATYGDVARAAGFPGAARQVVWALRAGSGLPWHRVVGARGKILLPGEAGMEQRLRLELEKVRFVNGRVDMETHGWKMR
jgi:methylated-DNA-protein-cysteine methyltransferase related protein